MINVTGKLLWEKESLTDNITSCSLYSIYKAITIENSNLIKYRMYSLYSFIFSRKSWQQSMRCRSWSEMEHFWPSADMEGEQKQVSLTLHQGLLRDFQLAGGAVPFSFFRGSFWMSATSQGGAGRNSGGALLISSTSEELYQRKKGLFTDQLVHHSPNKISSEAFFPKRMFHFVWHVVFIYVIWIYFISELRTTCMDVL